LFSNVVTRRTLLKESGAAVGVVALGPLLGRGGIGMASASRSSGPVETYAAFSEAVSSTAPGIAIARFSVAFSAFDVIARGGVASTLLRIEGGPARSFTELSTAQRRGRVEDWLGLAVAAPGRGNTGRPITEALTLPPPPLIPGAAGCDGEADPGCTDRIVVERPEGPRYRHEGVHGLRAAVVTIGGLSASLEAQKPSLTLA
jgi:hypothetical protein